MVHFLSPYRQHINRLQDAPPRGMESGGAAAMQRRNRTGRWKAPRLSVSASLWKRAVRFRPHVDGLAKAGPRTGGPVWPLLPRCFIFRRSQGAHVPLPRMKRRKIGVHPSQRSVETATQEATLNPSPGWHRNAGHQGAGLDRLRQIMHWPIHSVPEPATME